MATEKKTVKKAVKTIDYKARVLAEIEKLQKDSRCRRSCGARIARNIFLAKNFQSEHLNGATCSIERLAK